MKITCPVCGATFEVGEDEIGKWVVCDGCESAVRVESSVQAVEVGVPRAKSKPIQEAEASGTSREGAEWDSPVRIQPTPRRQQSGKGTYRPRKREEEVKFLGLILSGLTLAAAVPLHLFQAGDPPPKPRPPAPLVSEEKLLEVFSENGVENIAEKAFEDYERALRNGSAGDARVEAMLIGSRDEQRGDKADYQRWREEAERVMESGR